MLTVQNVIFDMISLNPLLLKNIAYAGSFKHSVFVFVSVPVFVPVFVFVSIFVIVFVLKWAVGVLTHEPKNISAYIH